ncbi:MULTISPECIES: AAA family ATPase [unclassified Phyllobacterium]|uniref:AAA family ATPase n=1 Tax=unclassified Phyllobacterium TaxID=2638441 RepID=UPI0030131C0C
MRIERAIREKTFTLTSIAGPSGSGKTYSALLYARGLVGPEGKIGFIDTENKRSRFYADVAGGFDVIDLDPPFTSSRYIEAIKDFEKAGYTAIVIDSISHEWEGTGGVLEQAEAIEQKTNRAGLHCWQKPKAGHKKLMNELLQTRAHLIFCCRVKEKVTQAKVNGKTEIINEGFVVVQEKSFIYEMTISMMLSEGTHIPTLQKCPGDLLPAFPEGQKITSKIGDSVREWSDKGEAIDEEFEAAKREGLLAANQGMKFLATWWNGLGKEQQKRLANVKETFKSVAAANDQMIADQMDAGGGDAGERLKHARAQSQQDGDSQEGFRKDFVSETLGSLSGGSENENAEPSTSVAPDVDAGGGTDNPHDPASEDFNNDFDEPIDEAEWLKGFAKIMVKAIGDNVDEFDQIRSNELIGGLSDEVSKLAFGIGQDARKACGAEDDVRQIYIKSIANRAGVSEKELVG